MRQRLLLPAAAVLLLLGLAVGLFDYRRAISLPLNVHRDLSRLIRPATTDWIAGLTDPARTLDLLQQPLLALAAVLLVFFCFLAAHLLNPRFRLLKPAGENPGRGAAAHIDLPVLRRAAAAVLLTLLLIGVLEPMAALAGGSRFRDPLNVMLGGLPLWAQAAPGLWSLHLLSLLLGLVFVFIWGPGGMTAQTAFAPSRAERFIFGLLAGAAAFPGVYLLFGFRQLLLRVDTSLSLADPNAWAMLLSAHLAAPAAGSLLLLAPLWACRPRRLSRLSLIRAGGAAVLATALGAALVAGGGRVATRFDLASPGLARRLGLPASDLARFAVLLPPEPPGVMSVTGDASNDSAGGDSIAANIETVRAVEQFLERRRYHTALAQRAFVHLHDSAALDWDTQRQLSVNLKMLQAMPSPIILQLLLQKLETAPITAGTKAILAQLADRTKFRSSNPDGMRWLAQSWLRVGEPRRAQALTQLPPSGPGDGARAALPTGGAVTGAVRIRGKSDAGMRLGLAPARFWPRLTGACPPGAWRWVGQSAITSAGGRFIFSGVPEGRYVLLISGGGVGRYRGVPMSAPYPGIIRITGDQPRADLGELDVAFMAAPERPGAAESEMLVKNADQSSRM